MRGYPYRMGVAAILAIAALRVAVGWHFFKEGANKLIDPNFTSRYFLEQAKGPLAPSFHALISDYNGRQRLDKMWILDNWSGYAERVKDTGGLNDQQKKLVDLTLASFQDQLQWWFDPEETDNQETIDTYFLELERLKAAEQNQGTRGIPAKVGFQQQWIAAKRAELNATRDGLLRELGMLDARLQSELSVALAPEPSADDTLDTSFQRLAKVAPLPDISRSWIDYAVKYFIFGVGVLLVIGLFTRVAALGAAAFLSSVIATQPFWIPGVEPTYYQAVEFVALLALAALGAGHFLGLDYLIDALRGRCCGAPAPQGTSAKEKI